MKARFVFIILLIFVASGPGRAQWVETSGADGMVSFVSYGSTLFAGNEEGLFETTDNGVSWSDIGFDSDWVQTLVVRNNTIFVGTLGHGIFRSTDIGSSWQADTAGLKGVFNVTGMVLSDSNLIISTNKGLFYSTTYGATWRPTPDTTQTLRIASFGDNVYAVESDVTAFYLWYSTDAGFTWTKGGALQQTFYVRDSLGVITDSFPQNYFCYSLVAIDSTVFSAGGNGTGVITSTDHGATWHNADKGLYAFPDTAIIPRFNIHMIYAYAGNIFMASNYGLFHSTDKGSNWSNISNDTLMYDDDSLIFNADGLYVWNGRLWAGADDAVWYRPLYQIFHEGGVSQLKDTKRMISIFPNPVGEDGNIAVNVSHSETYTISILNSLGITVATIFQGELSGGAHSFHWNAMGFPSGMYECVVRTRTASSGYPILIEH